MSETPASSAPNALQQLPPMDELLQTDVLVRLRKEAGELRSSAIAREAVANVRAEIVAEGPASRLNRAELLAIIAERAETAWASEAGKRTRRVINATGVVIHTNLGRAPLSAAAIDAIVNEAVGYSTVEYDLELGRRGKRGERAETLLCLLTGADAAIVVNNCAAAAFMVLSVFAKDREVIISRGELVEIGGDFRVPDVLIQSGATLREVGTTNRTKLRDYSDAVTVKTAMLLRVHPSNFRITGFTKTPTLNELSACARAKGLILYEDAGSGALFDMSAFGLTDEPVVSHSIEAGADIVTFSGDKLLGGPQAGLIVGRRPLIDALRKSPLYRAMRVSKLIYAALEATLESHARHSAENDVPVVRMLTVTAETLESRSVSFAARLSAVIGESGGTVEVVQGESVVGGGAAPTVHPLTSLIAIRPLNSSAASYERKLRMGTLPVIARLQNNRLIIDLRTVHNDEESELFNALTQPFRRDCG